MKFTLIIATYLIISQLTTACSENEGKTNLSGMSSLTDSVAYIKPNNDPEQTISVYCKDGRELCYRESEFYSKTQLLCEEGKNTHKWYVEFFNNKHLLGCPVWRADFDNFPEWHTDGKPLNLGLVNSDNFSAKISRSLYVNQGLMRFNYSYDDGIKVAISGCPSFEDWTNGSMRTHSIDCLMEFPRTVDIQINYYEDGGRADLAFSWETFANASSLMVPKNFRVSQFDGSGNFLLDWDRVDGANFYEVEVYLGNYGLGNLYHSGILRADFDDIWIVKNDLQGYATIDYRVRSRNNQGQASNWSNFATYTLPTPPVNPTPIVIVPPSYTGRCDQHPDWGNDCSPSATTGKKCIYSCYDDARKYMTYGTPICRVQWEITRC